MKLVSIYSFFIMAIYISCQPRQEKKLDIIVNSKIVDTGKNKITLKYPNIIVDIKIADTVKENITPSSWKESYKTKWFARFYVDDKLVETINGDSSKMISWYSIIKDTIDLVVHSGSGFFGSAAPVIRFINDS
jgi:hypothetical protein